MLEVICDKCSKKFEVKMKKRTHGVDITEHYFICPKCRKRYTSYVTDQEVRRLQKEVRVLSKELREHAAYSSPATYKEKVDEIDAKQKKNKMIMSKLKSEIVNE